METILNPKYRSISVRMAVLLLLVVGTPFAVRGMYTEGEKVGIWFCLALSLMLIWEFSRKLFGIPTKVVIQDDSVCFSYILRGKKKVHWSQILGYSNTLEATRYSWNKGVRIYLENRNYITVSDVNTNDIPVLEQNLLANGLNLYGEEKLWPGFSAKFKNQH